MYNFDTRYCDLYTNKYSFSTERPKIVELTIQKNNQFLKLEKVNESPWKGQAHIILILSLSFDWDRKYDTVLRSLSHHTSQNSINSIMSVFTYIAMGEFFHQKRRNNLNVFLQGEFQNLVNTLFVVRLISKNSSPFHPTLRTAQFRDVLKLTVLRRTITESVLLPLRHVNSWGNLSLFRPQR